MRSKNFLRGGRGPSTGGELVELSILGVRELL